MLDLDLKILHKKRFFTFQIIVVSARDGNLPIAKIPEKKLKNMKQIFLLSDDNYFDLITNIKGFYRSSYYCTFCNIGYNTKEKHCCAGICRCCYRPKSECVLDVPLPCVDCGRTFQNIGCS